MRILLMPTTRESDKGKLNEKINKTPHSMLLEIAASVVSNDKWRDIEAIMSTLNKGSIPAYVSLLTPVLTIYIGYIKVGAQGQSIIYNIRSKASTDYANKLHDNIIQHDYDFGVLARTPYERDGEFVASSYDAIVYNVCSFDEIENMEEYNTLKDNAIKGIEKFIDSISRRK